MQTRPEVRTWFITGANSGIGLALAETAVERGDNVVGLARSPEPLQRLAAHHPGRLLALGADVRDQAQIDGAVAQALDEFGHLDIVANGAGYGLFGGIEEVTDDQLRGIFETNVFGTVNVLRAVLPSLRAQRFGHVVMLSSYLGNCSAPGFGPISATKYAIEGLGDALVGELKPLGIHVTVIEPSPSNTNFRNNLQRAPSEIGDYDLSVRESLAAIRSLPRNHFNLPGPIAAAIVAVVDAEQPPLRLATGSVAVNSAREALEGRLAELAAWEHLSTAVDDDPLRTCPI